jgi:hypothetical protein
MTSARLGLDLRLGLGMVLGFGLVTMRGFEWQVNASLHTAYMCILTSDKIAPK